VFNRFGTSLGVVFFFLKIKIKTPTLSFHFGLAVEL